MTERARARLRDDDGPRVRVLNACGGSPPKHLAPTPRVSGANSAVVLDGHFHHLRDERGTVTVTTTSTKRRPRPPAGLHARGRKFWNATMAEFEMTDSEVALLTEVCRCLDVIDNLAETIEAEGTIAEGSKGQPVIHPAVTELRGQQVVLHRLISALALPDEDGDAVPTTGTVRARTAATARWSGVQTEARLRREGAS